MQLRSTLLHSIPGASGSILDEDFLYPSWSFVVWFEVLKAASVKILDILARCIVKCGRRLPTCGRNWLSPSSGQNYHIKSCFDQTPGGRRILSGCCGQEVTLGTSAKLNPDLPIVQVVGSPVPWLRNVYASVSETVVRGPQVVLGFCPCGPFTLNISPKKTEKIKLTWIAYHTL